MSAPAVRRRGAEQFNRRHTARYRAGNQTGRPRSPPDRHDEPDTTPAPEPAAPRRRRRRQKVCGNSAAVGPRFAVGLWKWCCCDGRPPRGPSIKQRFIMRRACRPPPLSAAYSVLSAVHLSEQGKPSAGTARQLPDRPALVCRLTLQDSQCRPAAPPDPPRPADAIDAAGGRHPGNPANLAAAAAAAERQEIWPSAVAAARRPN